RLCHQLPAVPGRPPSIRSGLIPAADAHLSSSLLQPGPHRLPAVHRADCLQETQVRRF
ncbi:hypothetical protein XENOCAPTIV_025020, partial [Xenoophorus captivus]